MSVVCDSVRPHRWQPTRLPRPWDSPGKNTGVGCHFLLQCVKVKSESEFAQSCPTLSDPMGCSPPGSSIHAICEARVMEWGAIAFSHLTLRGAILFGVGFLWMCSVYHFLDNPFLLFWTCWKVLDLYFLLTSWSGELPGWLESRLFQKMTFYIKSALCPHEYCYYILKCKLIEIYSFNKYTWLRCTYFCFFLWLSNIPLYIRTTTSLSIHLLMVI